MMDEKEIIQLIEAEQARRRKADEEHLRHLVERHTDGLGPWCARRRAVVRAIAMALLVLLPISVWFTMSQRRRMTRTNVAVKRQQAEINAVIESGISGVRTAKAFSNEEQENAKFRASNERYKHSKREWYRAMGTFFSSMEFTTSALQVVVIALGGLFIMRGTMDYIDLITFSLYIASFVQPIRALVMFMETFTDGMAGFGRFLELMRTEPAVQDGPDAKPLENVQGAVEFDDVSFRYETSLPVLEHVSLRLEPGQTLAVVGPTGGGKTTLCQLLPRFYDVTGGAVRIDGKDVRSLQQHSLRRSIGMLQQDVFIFADTIRENIRYGRPDATDEEIVAAAKRARSSRRRSAPRSTPRSWPCRTDTIPSSASAASCSPAGRSSASASPASFSKTRPSSFWTRPRARSTPSPSSAFSPLSISSPSAARRSSSPTASAPSKTPTASPSWRAQRSSSRERLPN